MKHLNKKKKRELQKKTTFAYKSILKVHVYQHRMANFISNVLNTQKGYVAVDTCKLFYRYNNNNNNMI